MGILEYPEGGLFSYSITYTTSTYQEKNIYIKPGIYNAQSISGTDLAIVDVDGDTMNISTSLGIISLKKAGVKIKPGTLASPTSWTNTQLAFGGAVIDSYDIGSEHYAVGPNNIFKTTDGISWTTVALTGLGATRTFTDIAYGNGKFLASLSAPTTLNQGLRESTDLVTWTTNMNFGNTNIQGLMFFKNKFIGFGLTSTSAIYKYSTNGTTWTQVTQPATSPGSLLPRLSHTPNVALVMYATSSGNFFHRPAGIHSIPQVSTDGITWTSTGVSFATASFVKGVNDYIASHYGSTFHFSTDAINWATTAETFTGLNAIRTITYANGFYLYGESNGEVAYDRTDSSSPPSNTGSSISLGTNAVSFLNYSTVQQRGIGASATSIATNKEIYPTSVAVLLSKGKSENIIL